MLRQVQIKNFRCLRNVKVPLRPFTVLIGPNDSGKSAFLQAISALISDRSDFEPSDHWKLDSKNEISLAGDTSRGPIQTKSYPEGKFKPYGAHEFEDRGSLVPFARYQLPCTGLAMECEGYSPEQERQLPIDSDGTGVPALLDYMLRWDRPRFFKVVEALRQCVPGLVDLNIATPEPHLRRIDFVIEQGIQLRSDLASVGVRIMLFFVAMAFHPKPPRVILLEEPENGIHPKRLADVLRLLRDLTKGRYGEYPAQMILTTHSPYLLDCIDLNEDQVLVFRREDDGSRSATPVDQERLKQFLDEFNLGEVWFNEEEAGLVAKP